MPNLFAVSKALTRIRKGGGAGDIGLQSTPDGALFTADWLTGMALEGRVINASVGISITPVTFATTAAWVITQPSLSIDVPSGTMIVPISIQVALQTEAGTLNTVLALTGTSNFGTGTSTAVTPRSMRTDVPITTACTVNSLFSGAGTTPATPMEFWRGSQPIASAAGEQWDFQWHYQQGAPVVIIGAGCLGVYVSGTSTAPTGYLKAQWVELPSSYYTT